MDLPWSEPVQGNEQSQPNLAQLAGDVRAIRRDDFDRDVWCLLGVPVDVTDIDGAVAEIDSAVRDRKRLSFITPNVNWLVRSVREPSARKEMLEADLSLIDGAPLVALSKLLSVPTPSRVAGSDLFEALRRRPSFAGGKIRVFFFGGRDGAADAAVESINRENSGLTAVGSYNPGFGDIDSMSAPKVIEQINKADPDFVVVALGAAKGQAWIENNVRHLTAPVVAHLGAVVDFTAGGVSRAPKWIQQCGMEWAWRIKEEPSLWKRYFLDGMSLIRIGLTQCLPQLRMAQRTEPVAQASARVENDQMGVAIRLAGDIGQANLRPIREAFRQAAAQGRDVCLDFSDVASFDRAFLGMVLMLEKHLNRSSRSIFLSGANPTHLRVLNANQMGYPVSAARLRPLEGAPATHAAAV